MTTDKTKYKFEIAKDYKSNEKYYVVDPKWFDPKLIYAHYWNVSYPNEMRWEFKSNQWPKKDDPVRLFVPANFVKDGIVPKTGPERFANDYYNDWWSYCSDYEKEVNSNRTFTDLFHFRPMAYASSLAEIQQKANEYIDTYGDVDITIYDHHSPYNLRYPYGNPYEIPNKWEMKNVLGGWTRPPFDFRDKEALYKVIEYLEKEALKDLQENIVRFREKIPKIVEEQEQEIMEKEECIDD